MRNIISITPGGGDFDWNCHGCVLWVLAGNLQYHVLHCLPLQRSLLPCTSVLFDSESSTSVWCHVPCFVFCVYIVFKYNTRSNLAQEIQFWEFMSGSILIYAHSNYLICMCFISNKYSRQFLSPLKWLTSPVHASWTWAKPRDLHIRLSLPTYRQFLLLEEYATWCWWAWSSEYTCQVRECLMEVACSS